MTKTIMEMNETRSLDTFKLQWLILSYLKKRSVIINACGVLKLKLHKHIVGTLASYNTCC